MPACVCCQSSRTSRVTEVAKIPYFQCRECRLIFADPQLLEQLDRGVAPRTYDAEYWKMELAAARERSFGASLARMAEVFYYSRIRIERFLDVGSGPGFFLDAVATHLPSRRGIFFGVEKFPPKETERTRDPNYLIGDVASLSGRFDAGLCMEVVEHLTPRMLSELLAGLARISNPKAAFIVNTGLADYVLKEDMGYLDPLVRGHVMAWSIESVRLLARDHGFSVLPIRGKSWAFVLEYQSTAGADEDIRKRVWSPVPANMETLSDPQTGQVLKILGMETIRAYGPI